MKESTVAGHIRRWLQEAGKPIFSEGSSGKAWGIDFLVGNYDSSGSWLVLVEQIECKGLYSDIYRAVGQSLYYYLINGSIPTFLAMPKDYGQVRTLRQIVDFFELPIGILLVDNSGQISLEREAKGKIRCYQKESGYHVPISKHIKLHFGIR